MSRSFARAAALAVLGALAACGDVKGLADTPTPLARVQVRIAGDDSVFPAGERPNLHVALVWGAQWVTEPFCFLPAESPAAQAVIDAGCRDPLGFAPARVAADVAIAPGTSSATLELFSLPTADLMVGDVTARVAYASLVVYDDRDGSGTLELHRQGRGGGGPPEPGDTDDAGVPLPESRDVVYGASFVSMAQPDQRLAFREGAFLEASGFYPRQGCTPPPPGFSVLAAGGFTLEAALAAALQGKLPEEDAASCATDTLEATVLIPLAAPETVRDVACLVRRKDGSVRYNEPPADQSFLDGRTWACAGFPTLGGEPIPGQQLVVGGSVDQTCSAVAHYTLRGCDNDPGCANPEWDRSASVPSWWPCTP